MSESGIPLPVADRPVSFGYKQIWMAMKDADATTVAAALGLRDVRPSSWEDGIREAYESGYDRSTGTWSGERHIFVSPPVSGWTLAVGGIRVFPVPSQPEFIPFLVDLSAKLGHVQWFASHRVSGVSAWAKAERGVLLRAYEYCDREVESEIGDPTPEEVDLGFEFLDRTRPTPEEIASHEAQLEQEYGRMCEVIKHLERLRAEAEARGEEFDESLYDDPRFQSRSHLLEPDEDSVMLLAGRWSVDPMKLEEMDCLPGLGLLGWLPTRRSRQQGR